MKHILLITVILFGFAFAKAQPVPSDLLLQTAHGNTTTRADITGGLQEGLVFYDKGTDGLYVYTNGQWRRVYYAPLVKPQTANYTLVPGDDGDVITFDSATDVVLTVPAGLEAGFNVSIYQLGAGRVTIQGAAGVNVLNRLSRFVTAGPNAGAGIISTGNNNFQITGDLKKQ